jgi:hypothetical protein
MINILSNSERQKSKCWQKWSGISFVVHSNLRMYNSLTYINKYSRCMKIVSRITTILEYVQCRYLLVYASLSWRIPHHAASCPSRPDKSGMLIYILRHFMRSVLCQSFIVLCIPRRVCKLILKWILNNRGWTDFFLTQDGAQWRALGSIKRWKIFYQLSDY